MSSERPVISIIIPTLNEAEYLPVLLESIEKQTFKNYEVIVGDAGSTDGTKTIAEKHGARVVPGGMPAVGRNSGAAAAEGDFFFFFDADVLLPPDFLEKAYNEMQQRYIDVATCEFYPDSDLRLDKLMFNFANLTVKLNQNSNPRAAGFCIFITRRLFNLIGGFDESLKLAEDHDLVERATEYSPLRVLESTSLQVSVRRLAKEGRFSLIEKYFKVEWHLLTKGQIRDDIIEYEFGEFTEDTEQSAKKVLDEFEERVIELENRYNDFAEKYIQGNRFISNIQENSRKWNESFDNLLNSFKGLLGSKEKDAKTE